MDNIPVYLRITGLTVSNEDVDSRRSAVSELVGAWRQVQPTDELLRKASEIAEALGGNGAPPAAIAKEVEGAIQNYASAFLYMERPLEVGIVAGMAIVDLVKSLPLGKWTVAEVLATALWSTLSFQPPLDEPKREALRMEVLEAVKNRSLKAAEAGRVRAEAPNFGELEIVKPDAEEDEFTSNFVGVTARTISALRQNAALDREELDFLWWSQLGRSRILKKPLTEIVEPIRLVAAGIEGAAYLRRLPCEVHRDIVLRTLDKDPELDSKRLLHVMSADRTALGGPYADGWATKWPAVFPLLAALATGEPKGQGHTLKRKSSEWGARALLEAGLVRLLSKGDAEL